MSNEETGVLTVLAEQKDQCGSKWFGHLERMENRKQARRMIQPDVHCERLRGRPHLEWMNCENTE